MKTGTRVIVTFDEGTNLDPSPGQVIDWLVGSDKGMHGGAILGHGSGGILLSRAA